MTAFLLIMMAWQYRAGGVWWPWLVAALVSMLLNIIWQTTLHDSIKKAGDNASTAMTLVYEVHRRTFEPGYVSVRQRSQELLDNVETPPDEQTDGS